VLFVDGVWRIFLVALGVIWIISGILGMVGSKGEKKSPTLTASAKVISKLSEQRVSGMGNVVTTKNEYFVTFEFPDGNRKKITVDTTQYALIAEEDLGVLEYKNLNQRLIFVSFQRQM